MGGGWRLRGYAVERLLGRGASGDVWRARVSGTGEPVALKRIHVSDSAQLRRAQGEAALLTALDHPHLVRLHAVVPTDDAVVLVLDLADGGTLADLLAVRGRLTPGEVITAIAPVAAALAYLHGEGVVHGDVSAANVLFTPDGVALLGDVGVARLVGERGEVACTPAYVDPAVAGGGMPGTPSDVFSLGAVALHALTGEPAWADETASGALSHAAQSESDDSLRFAGQLERAGVSIAMAAVICRAMSIDPHRRGTAADLALDLRHSGEPVAVELAAGRRRIEPEEKSPRPPSGPRHAARVGAASSPAVDDAGRPGFERPSAGSAVASVTSMRAVGSAPPTRLVGPRPRPAVPRPRAGARRFLPGRRIVLFGCAALITVLLAAGGTVWAATRTAPSTVHRNAKAPTPTPTRLPGSAEEAAAVLGALDASRAAAFRSDDVALLARVYVAGPLRTADAAMVRRIVPRGCGLLGARTTYTAVRMAASGSRVVVNAMATLPRTRLVCSGRSRGTAAGAGPTPMRVELVRTPAGVRIAAQEVG